MKLRRTKSVPVFLCHPVAVKHGIYYLNNSDTKSIDVAYKNAFRKIYNSHWRESVKPLQYYCKSLHPC